MKRLAAALFGLFVAVGVLSAAPASATGIQVTGNVYNTAVISINDGTVEFYDSCDAQTPVAIVNNVSTITQRIIIRLFI